MAKRGKAGDKVVDNDFDLDTAQAYFDRLDEVNKQMREDAAAGRGDMNAIYDEMVDDLGVTKDAAKFLWARHRAEERFQNAAKKMDPVDRKALERFAGAMEGTPFGDWASEAAELSEDADDNVQSKKIVPLKGKVGKPPAKVKPSKVTKPKTPKGPRLDPPAAGDAGPSAA